MPCALEASLTRQADRERILEQRIRATGFHRAPTGGQQRRVGDMLDRLVLAHARDCSTPCWFFGGPLQEAFIRETNRGSGRAMEEARTPTASRPPDPRLLALGRTRVLCVVLCRPVSSCAGVGLS